ncbi:hypothetical protein AVEN_164926-1 [Araneus ventricosus]|uniref:Uncharacterized protein n=1 Tax=Araneus ventricosus TaxID=182803 RepID=A0A4Y2FWK3_ARAVE|nr:hypothetical protein AVEN_164926-1 [Araneus ventricosus]
MLVVLTSLGAGILDGNSDVKSSSKSFVQSSIGSLDIPDVLVEMTRKLGLGGLHGYLSVSKNILQGLCRVGGDVESIYANADG